MASDPEISLSPATAGNIAPFQARLNGSFVEPQVSRAHSGEALR